jgi:hypothetical protein
METKGHITLAEDFLRRHPPSAFERLFWMQMIGGWIEEAERGFPGFKDGLRSRALAAVTENDETLIRRAVQCLAFVGHSEDVARLKPFLNHPVAKVAQDAKNCIFEIVHRKPTPISRHSTSHARQI